MFSHNCGSRFHKCTVSAIGIILRTSRQCTWCNFPCISVNFIQLLIRIAASKVCFTFIVGWFIRHYEITWVKISHRKMKLKGIGHVWQLLLKTTKKTTAYKTICFSTNLWYDTFVIKVCTHKNERNNIWLCAFKMPEGLLQACFLTFNFLSEKLPLSQQLILPSCSS